MTKVRVTYIVSNIDKSLAFEKGESQKISYHLKMNGFEGALKADKETIERVLENYELTESQKTVLTAQLNKL